MLLVVGLGNPGRRYADHRHNVGFRVVDELARRGQAGGFRAKFSGELARVRLEGEDALLLKPMTYMNESGRSVQPTAAFFRIPSSDILVVHDELDLPFGTLRLKRGGGHAGHKGLRSVAIHLGGSDFSRLRFGIDRPPPEHRGDVADYVLSPFCSEEREKLHALVELGAQTVLDIAARGFDAAMKLRNTRPSARRRASAEAEGPTDESASREEPS